MRHHSQTAHGLLAMVIKMFLFNWLTFCMFIAIAIIVVPSKTETVYRLPHILFSILITCKKIYQASVITVKFTIDFKAFSCYCTVLVNVSVSITFMHTSHLGLFMHTSHLGIYIYIYQLMIRLHLTEKWLEQCLILNLSWIMMKI